MPELTVEELMAEWPDEVLPIGQRMRALVREVAPEVTERAYPGWRLIGYRVRQYFCGIYPADGGVRFLFERGRELHDPEGLLDGAGSQTRHVDVRPGPGWEQAVDALRDLVAQAVALQE